MATGGGGPKRNAEKTLFDLNFVKKKKTTEDEDIAEVTSKVIKC